MSTDTLVVPEYEAIEPSSTFERLVMARLEALEAENRELKDIVEEQQKEIDALREEIGRERAFDRKRISKLETRKQQTGPKSREQISELMNYLQDCPNHITPLEGARHHLGVSKNRLSNLLASPDAENQFLLIKNPNDHRKRLIKLRPQI